MRRNYISPELEYTNVYGTFNMIEESSYFGSKMLEIENKITIGSKSIIYYQKDNKEQLDYISESKLNPLIFDVVDYKYNSQKIKIDETQSESQRNDKTKWVVNISLSDILLNYLFGILKEHRTFEGVANHMTVYGDVDVAMKNYINNNILNRYKFSAIDLYLQYKDLRGQNILKHNNNFSQLAETSGAKLNKIEVFTDYNQTLLEVRFNQEKSSSEFSFDYYFNLNFEKI